MTPMERACLEMGSCDDPVDMKMTRAVVTAYLAALPEDKETVERVAVAFLREEHRECCTGAALDDISKPSPSDLASATAALRTLTAKE